MTTTPRKLLLSLRFMEANGLSPIPEIVSSNCVSPDISPEPLLEPTSKSAKLLSPISKITKIKKIDRRDINIRIQKKISKLQKTKKKNDSILSIQDIDSHAIYLKNKQEIQKLFPEVTEKKTVKAKFFSKSPQRPEASQFITRKKSRRETLPKYMNNNLKSPTEKESEFSKKFSDSSLKISQNHSESKFVFDVMEKFSKKRNLVNKKLNKLTEIASEEIRGITRSIIQKKIN